jgi:hypothetical protein
MSENTRTTSDPCYINNKETSNYDRLKFLTTSFTDLLDAQRNGQYFGSTTKREYAVPADKIDTYSQLVNGVRGDYNSKCYTTRGTNNPLPLPTFPSQINLAHGNFESDDLRGSEIRPKNPLRYVPDNISRTFGIFDGMVTPSNMVDITNRSGEQTRFS